MVSKQKYKSMSEKATPKGTNLINCVNAFIYGGIICVIGQLFIELFKYWNFTEDQIMIAVPVTLIVIASLLTAFKIYDTLAKRGGAGMLIPITGFANAVVSPAMEFKTEGYVLGTGVKMFAIAGPVIVFGAASGVIYGLILWILKVMG